MNAESGSNFRSISSLRQEARNKGIKIPQWATKKQLYKLITEDMNKLSSITKQSLQTRPKKNDSLSIS
jgi:hypothetical protein